MVIDAKGLFVNRNFHLRGKFGIHVCNFSYHGDQYQMSWASGYNGGASNLENPLARRAIGKFRAP